MIDDLKLFLDNEYRILVVFETLLQKYNKKVNKQENFKKMTFEIKLLFKSSSERCLWCQAWKSSIKRGN